MHLVLKNVTIVEDCYGKFGFACSGWKLSSLVLNEFFSEGFVSAEDAYAIEKINGTLLLLHKDGTVAIALHLATVQVQTITLSC